MPTRSERENVVLDTAGAVELLTRDPVDGPAFIKGVYRDCWCPMAERWLFTCGYLADTMRALCGPDMAAGLVSVMRELARPPDDWADYSGP